MKLKVFDPSRVARSAVEMEFVPLCDFDDGGGGVFWSAEGTSPWEMHPDCDELLHVVEGRIDVEVLPSEGGAAVVASLESGAFLVVPRGCWHRQHLLQKSTEFYLTPGRTLHSQEEDPRLGRPESD